MINICCCRCSSIQLPPQPPASGAVKWTLTHVCSRCVNDYIRFLSHKGGGGESIHLAASYEDVIQVWPAEERAVGVCLLFCMVHLTTEMKTAIRISAETRDELALSLVSVLWQKKKKQLYHLKSGCSSELLRASEKHSYPSAFSLIKQPNECLLQTNMQPGLSIYISKKKKGVLYLLLYNKL